jgi:deferrochelatase/peroxidase EfeB
LGLAGDEETGWTEPARAEVGHGMNVRVRADASHFHLLISCGDTDENWCQQLLQELRATLDEIGEIASAVHARHTGSPAARRRPIRISSNDSLTGSGGKGARG